MRAERLLSILMILQGRGSLTAERLARELKVSVRTIYRDIASLSAIGVPVYGDGGPGGGYALMPGYRSGITGLTEEEVRALALVRVPAGAAALGADSTLRSALQKLLAAADREARDAGEVTRRRILIDSRDSGEGFVAENVDSELSAGATVQLLHRAVMENLMAEITFQMPFALEITQLVAPLGLVCRGQRWHLVHARGGTSAWHNVSAISRVVLPGTRFSRDPRFDLEEYWREVQHAELERSHSFAFCARVAPLALRRASWIFHGQLRTPALEPSAWPRQGLGERTRHSPREEWELCEISSDSLESARRGALALGGAIEVLSPAALRDTVADYAFRTAALYR